MTLIDALREAAKRRAEIPAAAKRRLPSLNKPFRPERGDAS